MFDLEAIGKMLLLLGGAIFVLGLVLILAGKVPFLGHLPGDIRIEGKGFSCYFPLVTSILISIILSLLVSSIAYLLKLLSK